MSTCGQFTWQEITTQGQSWACAIDAVQNRKEALLSLLADYREEPLLFVGCGSTHYLARFAAPFFQRVARFSCRGLPSSELALQTDTVVLPGQRPLVVALSRSGETTETVMAVERMRERQSQALVISCYDDTPLSRLAALTVSIPDGREESYAQTRSFAGMLVAVQMLAALVAKDQELEASLKQLPDLADGVIQRAQDLARQFGADERFKRITFLGSGPYFGLASEATVKMKEMSLSLAEPYRFMEFRHGPMSLVDEEHLIVALLSDRMREYELAVLRDLQERGATVLAIAEDQQGLDDMATFCLCSGLSEEARSVLYLPFVQLMAYYRAVHRGLNPDRPRNVVMAIHLDGTEMES